MRPRRVLVVDDESSQRRLYSHILESAGFIPAQAESGANAIEFIKNERPRLLVADISMPGVDGIQLYQAIHRDQRTANIPVLLMTGMPVPRSLLRAAGLALGVDEIYVKGDDPGRFIGLVTKLTRAQCEAPTPTLTVGNLERVMIDATRRRIWIDSREIPRLPPKRYDVLVQLLNNSEPQSPGKLLQNVWPESDNANIVGISIMRLRRDLGDFPSLRIETTALGYVARLAP